MKLAKTIALIGLIAMTAALLNAFLNGSGSVELSSLLSMPWGIVSLVDLYTGFFLFSIWIAYREPTRIHAAIWIVLLMVLGFFIGSLYTFVALQKSNDDWRHFWLGAKA